MAKNNGNVRNQISKFEERETSPIEMKNFKANKNNGNNVAVASGIPSPTPRTHVPRPSAPPAPPPVYSRVFSQTEKVSLLNNLAKGPRSPETDVNLSDHEYDTIDEPPRDRDRDPRVRRPVQEEPTRISHTHLNISDNRNRNQSNQSSLKSRPIPRISSTSCNFTHIAIILAVVCIVQLIILIILAVYLLTSKNLNYSGISSITKNKFGHARPGELIFYDDFDTFNLSLWRHDRYISHDGFVIYGTNENNSYVEDGILYIEPTYTEDHFDGSFLTNGDFQIGKSNNESCSSFIPSQCRKTARRTDSIIINPIMSAALKTSQSFTFQYGVIEIRAKMPKGDWISTEISLQPRYKYYGEPTDSAKIILITTRGNSWYYALNKTHYGNERFCSQLIYSDAHSTAVQSMVQFCQNSEPKDGFGEDFHTYKFDWTPELMKIYVDDKMTGKFIANSFVPEHVKHIVVPADGENEQLKSSFDQQFYIQLKVAVGVGFPDTGFQSAYIKPWTNHQHNAPYRFWYARRNWENSWQNRSAALQVDYIKVKAL